MEDTMNRTNDKQGLQGVFQLRLVANNGCIKDDRMVYNVVTTAGKASLAGLLVSDVGGSAYDYIAIGTGTTAATNTQTALVGEIQRVAGAGSRTDSGTPNDTAVLVSTYSFTGGFAVAEAGMFNTAAGGTMFCRQTFTVLNVTSGDSLSVTYKVTMS